MKFIDPLLLKNAALIADEILEDHGKSQSLTKVIEDKNAQELISLISDCLYQRIKRKQETLTKRSEKLAQTLANILSLVYEKDQDLAKQCFSLILPYYTTHLAPLSILREKYFLDTQ